MKKIITYIVCLIMGVTVAQAQATTGYGTFLKEADTWYKVKSVEMSNEKVVYTLDDGTQKEVSLTHGESKDLQICPSAIYCEEWSLYNMDQTARMELFAQVGINGALTMCGKLGSLDFDPKNLIYDCIKNIKTADLSHLDLSQVSSMNSLFYDCKNLEYINFGGSITAMTNQMYNTMEGCKNLRTVDFSNCDLSNLTQTYNVFTGCDALETIIVKGCNEATISKLKEVLTAAGKDPDSKKVKLVTDYPTE